MREYLGIYQNPLDEHVVRVRRLYFGHSGGLEASIQTWKAQYIFHYFPKIVSIQFRTLDDQIANSHQHSAARFERDLTTSQAGNMNEGVQMYHGATGMTG
jgi:hypothetical protein